MKYDYIIAGAGCAGLSLLYRILKNPVLCNKHILLIDKDPKNDNDRTFCFWEKENGLFQEIVRHEWRTLEFKTEHFVNRFDLLAYKYKMIRGIDFYRYVLNVAGEFKNVNILQDEIAHIDVQQKKVILQTTNTTFYADYLFNSTGLMNPKLSSEDTLLQHFLGWEIKIDPPKFNQFVGTLMDFSIDQKHGTTFMYMLPVSEDTALVEYTLFTEKLLPKAAYRLALSKYIKEVIQIQNYEILHEEFGIIPMSLQKFPAHFKQKVIHIGTAGGHTKASSGYTFQFVQKYTEKIVERLALNKSPLVPMTLRDKVFQWYDRTMLEVIISNKMAGKDIFSLMFKKLAPEKILKFLDNESTFLEDLSIMSSLPTGRFMQAGIKQLL